MHSNQEIELFDTVLRFIWNCREQAVNRLYPNQLQLVKDELVGYTTYRFWNHLGEHDQRRIIQFAREHYAAPEYEGGT